MKYVIKIRKGEHEKRNNEMQKRNPAVLMGVGRVTKTGRKDGAFRFPVPSYADYQRPRDYPEIRQELERMNQEINRIGVNINQITHNNNSALYSREDKTPSVCVFEADKNTGKPGAGKAVGYGNYKVPAHETGKNGLSSKTSGKRSSLYYEPGENRTWPLCLWT